MRRAIAVLLIALTCPAFAQNEAPVKFIRTPALSPKGNTIAFSYQGNIWTVGTNGGVATRLTANNSYDLNPKWSPSGDAIAFNSDREGGNQVFIIPSTGGQARQITSYSTGTLVLDWFPDGQSLLVLSNRGQLNTSLYRLDVQSGRYTLIHTDRIPPLAASLSPDGKRFAYYRGSLPDTLRRNYKGAANHDIYVGTVDGSEPAKALWRDPQKMNDMWPVWSSDGRSVFFAHDTGKNSILYKIPATGGSPQNVENAPDLIRYANAAKGASKIVYECLNELYIYDGETSKARKLDVICRTDTRGPRNQYETFSGTNVQEFKLSPDGKRTALVLRGDVWVVNNERGGEAKRVTNTADREVGVDWALDGKSLVFSSNRDGLYNLYSTVLSTLETKQLTKGGTNSGADVSPDGKWIAYSRQPKPSIRIMKADGTEDHEVVAGPGVFEFEWSPDSKWIAFTRTTGYWHSDIFAVKIDDKGMATGSLIPISDHAGENLGPQWFKNGEKIAFRSNRYRNRDIETINHSGRFTLYVTPLEKAKDTFDFDEDTEAAPPKPDPKKPIEVKIDPDEIALRARLVFPFFEAVGAFTVSPDSSSLVFNATSLGVGDLYQVSADGGGVQKLTNGGDGGSQFQWSPDGSRLYYLRAGSVVWIGKGGQGRGSVGFTARMEINRREDMLAVFDEAWQTINETFYDETFRGQDWKAIKAKYRAQVPDVSIRQDLNYLVNQMLGELNASHMGFSGGTAPAVPARPTGMLGILPDSSYSGPGVKVARIIKRSPATKAESLLKVGEIILDVDGKPVQDGLGFDLALADKVGRTVVLTVNAVASTTNARKVKIRPTSFGTIDELLYEEWIDANRAMVDKLSGGKLGYLHVPDMGDEARNRFERELFGFGNKKEGMVLDFRFNNGGDTHDSLLKFLDRRKQYLTMTPRNDVPYKQPEHLFTKPTIVITDEFSLSDAEVFTMGYKELKIGKVVGRPTMGWIIFTSGRPLVDGSFIRTPYIACLTPDGKDMENWGVPPDVEVFFEPGDFAKGVDPQIERAVGEMLRG